MTTQPDKHDRHVEAPPTVGADRIRDAMNRAFDYRGDVTITTTDGAVIEGYLFDRNQTCADPYVRIIPRDRQEKVTVRYADVASLQFTGRDPAEGKSWETWVKNYVQKKLRGEKASLEAENLE